MLKLKVWTAFQSQTCMLVKLPCFLGLKTWAEDLKSKLTVIGPQFLVAKAKFQFQSVHLGGRLEGGKGYEEEESSVEEV